MAGRIDNGHFLNRLFFPEKVAIIGAGDNPLLVNGRSLMFMLRHATRAAIYPVNPGRSIVQGVPCFPAIGDLPEVPDVAVIVVGRALVPQALEDLGRRGCPFAIINTSGYAETGPAGRNEQDELLRIAGRYGMRLIGPNCLGLVNLLSPVILSWCATLERDQGTLLAGNVAMISQSGALLGSIWDRAIGMGLGYSHLISTGNEADLGLADFMDYMVRDENTRVITAFLESLRDPRGFVRAVEDAHERGKAVVVYKVGRTAEGRRAAVSHTGSLTGSDEVFDALCRKHGIVRVESLEALNTAALALSREPAARGGRLGIFCCSGGAAGMIADQMRGTGLSIPPPRPELNEDITAITNLSPPHNPLDIIKGPLKSFDLITLAMRRFAEEDDFDQIIILMTTMYLQKVAPALMLEGLKGRPEKPVIACWLGDRVVEESLGELKKGGLTVFRDIGSCLEAARALAVVGEWRRHRAGMSVPLPAPEGARIKAIEIIEQCGRRPDEASSKQILSLYGIPVPWGKLVSSLEEALEAASEIGYPVCVKGASADIAHKTEAGAIALNIKNERELKSAARRIAAAVRPKGVLRGLLVEEMLPAPAAEVIIGSSPDETGFRKIVFGLGGIWVEALGDVSLRLAPLSQIEAEEMIAEIRGRKLLAGFRGKPAADRESIVEVLLKFSALLADLGDHVKEVEINPLMVFENGVVAADALITCAAGNGLSPAPGETPPASVS